jgi:hypothetical protein
MIRETKMAASIIITNGVFQGRITDQHAYRDLYFFNRSDAKDDLEKLKKDIGEQEQEDRLLNANSHYYAHFIISDANWANSSNAHLSFNVSNLDMQVDSDTKKHFTFFIQESVIDNQAGLQLAIVTHYGVEGLYVLREPETDTRRTNRWILLTEVKLQEIGHSYHMLGVCGRHRRMIPNWL